MSCCGGGRPRNVRHQAIVQSASKQSATPIVQKRISSRRSNSGSGSETRQYIVSSQQCVKCGYPIMLVKISGKERSKCSNVNCGELL